MKNTSETVKCGVMPTYFEGSFPPENPGETKIHKVGLDNGGCIKIYLNDTEEGERLANLIVTACNSHDVLLDACQSAFDMLSSPKFKAWRDENCKSDENWAMVSAMNLRQVELAEAISLATTT